MVLTVQQVLAIINLELITTQRTPYTTDQELNLEIFNVPEDRKKYLLSKIKPYTDMNCTLQHINTYINYNNAHLIAQYLASKRPFSQSFDKYLQVYICCKRTIHSSKNTCNEILG